MPSKKRHQKNLNLDFELPPTTLSKHANLSKSKSVKQKKTNNTTNTDYLENDTPKAFARLMSVGAKRKRGGEEDLGGPREKKKPSQGNKKKNPFTQSNNTQQKQPQLQILPGESLRAFNRRVDASMPISLKGKGNGKPDPINPSPEPSSKSKSKSKSKSTAPLPGEQEEDYSDYLTDSSDYSVDSHGEPRPKTFRARPHIPRKKIPGQKKKVKPRGPSPDPFAVLLEKRGKTRFGETAEAPPQLRVKPKEILRAPRGVGRVDGEPVLDVHGVPKKVGSIAKREMLAEERRSVVEKYREMVEGRRAVGGG